MTALKAKPDEPWHFRAVVSGDTVQIEATFSAANIDRFERKLAALKSVLDAAPVIEAPRP